MYAIYKEIEKVFPVKAAWVFLVLFVLLQLAQ